MPTRCGGFLPRCMPPRFIHATRQHGAPALDPPQAPDPATGGPMAASKMRFSPSSPPVIPLTRPRATRTRQRDKQITREHGTAAKVTTACGAVNNRTKTRKRPPRHTCSGAGAVGPPCPPCCPAASTHGRGTASVRLIRHSAARRGPSSRIAHGHGLRHGLPATGRAAGRRARGGGARVRGARVHVP